VASKKVALSGRGRKWYEKVDKKNRYQQKQGFWYWTPEKVMKMTSIVELHALKCQNHCFAVIDFSYLLFHTCFYRGLKVRLFLLATVHGYQTKMLEGRTNRPERVFEALFKGVSTRFGVRNVEKCAEKMFRTVLLAFQTLRLGSISC
jgi:hypothetical protein